LAAIPAVIAHGFADANQRIKLTGIIIVMYSPQTGPPARMYMLVADKDGVAGVTVWGDTVAQLMGTANVVGQAVSIPGCTMSFYNNKRSLNVPRNHLVHFADTSPHLDWWSAKLQAEPVTTKQLLTLPDQSITSIFAVVASIRREEKTACKLPISQLQSHYDSFAAALTHTCSSYCARQPTVQSRYWLFGTWSTSMGKQISETGVEPHTTTLTTSTKQFASDACA
jgi:hypothetical protein